MQLEEFIALGCYNIVYPEQSKPSMRKMLKKSYFLTCVKRLTLQRNAMTLKRLQN